MGRHMAWPPLMFTILPAISVYQTRFLFQPEYRPGYAMVYPFCMDMDIHCQKQRGATSVTLPLPMVSSAPHPSRRKQFFKHALAYTPRHTQTPEAPRRLTPRRPLPAAVRVIQDLSRASYMSQSPYKPSHWSVSYPRYSPDTPCRPP